MNKSLPNYELGGPNPKNFTYTPGCATNQQAQLIPEPGSNSTHDIYKPCTVWETVPMGPTTLKHLYSPIPGNYEQRMITRPVNTLYGHQYIENYPTGIGRLKIKSDHYKVYPLTNRHVVESRDYTSYVFPQPQWPSDGLITYDNHVRVDGRK